ncbi:helix-turn-helix domain-containing protein [Microbispora hainanensis]|uniref:Helix-turn-helix domain-containing protein n=1 Tax=Microbispora hainanensis TaxID=568844 RepID=A0A544YXJ7_9ACTN|nr:helix-turn-helix domain-containing protein [Microbispora hainanensis]TQS21468.1 hypothetical protein FLX08_11615 [Microbispora hainanensis]
MGKVPSAARVVLAQKLRAKWVTSGGLKLDQVAAKLKVKLQDQNVRGLSDTALSRYLSTEHTTLPEKAVLTALAEIFGASAEELDEWHELQRQARGDQRQRQLQRPAPTPEVPAAQARDSPAPVAMHAGDSPDNRERSRPRRRRGRWLVPVAGAGATVVAGLVLVLLLHAPGEETAAVATSASPPPAPDPGYGFAMRIDRMAFRILSREWTQTSAGDVELWWNNSCPEGTTTYWVALRPTGEAARFSCNSWQYRKWAGVPAGTYHLEFWKDQDGRSLHGSGAMRASVPIIVHPKPVPVPHPAAS